jgi:hypothetical protein
MDSIAAEGLHMRHMLMLMLILMLRNDSEALLRRACLPACSTRPEMLKPWEQKKRPKKQTPRPSKKLNK